VRQRWQPRVRELARGQAATTAGVTIDTRARFGFTSPVGTTDDARVRHLTLALPPISPTRRTPAPASNGYFHGGGSRANGLEVYFTAVSTWRAPLGSSMLGRLS
jgi:hypothetical protein